MSPLRRLGATLATLLILATAGCGQEPAEPIRVGTNTWPGYEPLYLARARDDLPEARIRLVEYPSASEVIRALRNGSLEAAALTLDEALSLAGDGIPIKVFLVTDVSHGGDVILARPGITGMQDLAGKRIGVEATALGAYMLTRALQSSGMSTDDVIVRPMEFNAHENAYRRGEVDAVVTFEPVRTRLINAGAVEVFNSRQLPGEIVDVLVARADVFAQRRDGFRALADSWFRALDFLDAQPDEAARIMARRLKITPAEVLASYQGLILPDRQDNLRMLAGDAPGLQAALDRLHQVMTDNGLLRADAGHAGLLSGAALR